MSLPPVLSRCALAVRRSAGRMRPRHVVALSAVAVAAFGLVGLRAVDLPGPRPVTDSERIRIEVVPPVEPELIAGSRMEVGDLVDGFQGVPPPPPQLTDAHWSDDDGREFAGVPPYPEDRRADVRTWDSRPPPEPPRDSPARVVRRWFGFDEPRRDFQAEREARRARLEAMEQAARERQDFQRRRFERAEQDRYAAERRAEAPRWRDDPHRDEPRDNDWRGEALPDDDDLTGGTAVQSGPRPYSLADEVG